VSEGDTWEMWRGRDTPHLVKRRAREVLFTILLLGFVWSLLRLQLANDAGWHRSRRVNLDRECSISSDFRFLLRYLASRVY